MLNKLKEHYYNKGLRHGIESAICLLHDQDPKLAEEAADAIGSIGSMWHTNKHGKKTDVINLYALCNDEIERLKSSK